MFSPYFYVQCDSISKCKYTIDLLNPGGFYVPPGLTFKNFTWCSLGVKCFVRISEQTATFAL